MTQITSSVGQGRLGKRCGILLLFLLAGCATTKTVELDRLTQLRADWPAFVLKQLQMKKPDSWPLEARVMTITPESGAEAEKKGRVKVKYRVSFAEKAGDETAKNELESEAILDKTPDGWLVVQVNPGNQVLSFDVGSVVKAHK